MTGLPPGPDRSRFQLGLEWFRQPMELMDECARHYGDPFTLRLPEPMGDTVLTSEPALIRSIFHGSSEVLRAGESHINIEALTGKNSLLLLDGKRHLRERRVMLPAFHADRLRLYTKVVLDVTTRAIDTWPFDQPFSLRTAMQEISFDVILRAVFGIDDAERHTDLCSLLRQMVEYGQLEFTLVPLMRRRGEAHTVSQEIAVSPFLDVAAKVNRLLIEEISRRRNDGATSERGDVLSLLLSARYDDGSPLGNQELRDELVTLLIAGHETTATALAWVFELLFRHREARGRLESELDEGRSGYLYAVLHESMRLRPVFVVVTRKLSAPFQLGEFTIPAGSTLAPSIYLAHRREDLYPEPNRFLPERFLADKPPETYSWLPFGGGVKRCIGASFAMQEMQIVLRTVLTRTRLEPARPDAEPPVRLATTFVPRYGALAIRTARSGETATWLAKRHRLAAAD